MALDKDALGVEMARRIDTGATVIPSCRGSPRLAARRR